MSKSRSCSLPVIAFVAMSVFASSVPLQAALLTSLNPPDALYDGGVGSTTPAVTRADGHTFNIEFTPAADDLTGTVFLLEIGGTSNGTGMYLVDGVLTYITKQSSNDNSFPSSLNDTSLPPAAVQSSFGPLTAGAAYSAAASWDHAGGLQLAIQSDRHGALNPFTLTGTPGNWEGNRTFGVGAPNGSRGGLTDEAAGDGDPGEPDTFNALLAKDFTGTVQRALFWNASGPLAAIPEPSSITLMSLVLMCAAARRWRQ